MPNFSKFFSNFINVLNFFQNVPLTIFLGNFLLAKRWIFITKQITKPTCTTHMHTFVYRVTYVVACVFLCDYIVTINTCHNQLNDLYNDPSTHVIFYMHLKMNKIIYNFLLRHINFELDLNTPRIKSTWFFNMLKKHSLLILIIFITSPLKTWA
jgi:hypothetical protein